MVTLGLETSTDAEVVSGLTEGEAVIVSDRSGLKPGQKVRPQAVQMLQYQERGSRSRRRQLAKRRAGLKERG